VFIKYFFSHKFTQVDQLFHVLTFSVYKVDFAFLISDMQLRLIKNQPERSKKLSYNDKIRAFLMIFGKIT